MSDMLLIFSVGVVAGIVLGILMLHEWADFTDFMLSSPIWLRYGACQDYLAWTTESRWASCAALYRFWQCW